MLLIERPETRSVVRRLFAQISDEGQEKDLVLRNDSREFTETVKQLFLEEFVRHSGRAYWEAPGGFNSLEC